ncbi:MAG: endonuclease III [Cytophagales bacterium]|nr:endonuclease III [Armatimonadota bacterium]
MRPFSDDGSQKEPFEIVRALSLITKTVAPYPPAALFQQAAEGYDTLLEVLVGCIISIRTRDEDSLPTAKRLFARARTPNALAALSPEEIEVLIGASQFAGPKARQIREIARQTVETFGGALPCDEATLLALPGVGPKCANLALGIACGAEAAPHVGVDIHVHRITNRWGYVATKTPEKTKIALDAVLPPRYRLEINRLLVPFGKHVCTGVSPRCSTCPVLPMCAQVGVGAAHR